MKTSNQLSKYQFSGLLTGLVVATMVLGSCSKDENEVIIEGRAKIMIVNAASGSPAQDFYLDNSKVNAEAVAYSQSTSYISTDAGNGRKAEFKNNSNASVNFTGYVDLTANENYTFFYTGKADGSGNSSAVFKDEQTSPSPNKAKLRFVNLAEGLASANLMITGGLVFASNVAFGTASSFSEVDPGTFALQTVLATSTSTSANLGSFTLQAGKIYTIYTSGSLSGSAQTAISAKMLTHN
ncbi:MAG: DUF4397 domain-containing protein [Daejeonella sp.]|uniref:DUF4397 domain-containing protein n=1 Tax=Daejeonella sp. TaxID=2805397 RepID=UPI0027326904|nr:DUF4397 domain-containing protein [Daejeonella sp.]MDP3467406.1 DUF4397 domain-containing protein [Daejeonella sp.]